MGKRPNIIFMMTDDQRWDTFGFMGNKHIYTPNLDKLAEDGVRFKNAYHVVPICQPSRASVHLGKYLSEHKSGFDKPTNFTVSREEFKNSYPVLLRENGYYTGFIGKFGYAVTENKKENATMVINKAREDLVMRRENRLEDKEENMPKDQFDVWYGFPGQGNYLPDKNGCFNGYANKWGATHLNEFMGYQAIEFINDAVKLGKPFNLSISFKAPHRPLIPEQRFLDKYENIKIPRQINDAPEYFEKLPQVVKEKSRNADMYFGRRAFKKEGSWLNEDKYQRDMKRYYALISGVDDVVGRIRKELERLNIADNTVIIYTSDNGMFCGSKQLHGKAILYEESVRAPMIVYDPRLNKEKQNRWIEGLISHVDIAPTILDLAEVPIPKTMRGKSYMPLIRGEQSEIHDAIFGENNFTAFYPTIDMVENPEEYQSIRSNYVRTKEYKYIRYHECHPVIEELWKIDEDPLEVNDLSKDPKYKHILEKMRNLLNEFEQSNYDGSN